VAELVEHGGQAGKIKRIEEYGEIHGVELERG
jgi:hypothetical protein